MVSHWNLSGSKSSQVSRTLLSILADLNNAVVWMVSLVLLFPQSLYQSFGDCTKCTNYNWYHRHFHVPLFFFNSLWWSKYLSFFLFSFNFTLWGQPGQQSSQFGKFSFLVHYYKVWSSGRDEVIRLYLKIPVELEGLILQDWFWVVHIPFVHIFNEDLFIHR